MAKHRKNPATPRPDKDELKPIGIDELLNTIEFKEDVTRLLQVPVEQRSRIAEYLDLVSKKKAKAEIEAVLSPLGLDLQTAFLYVRPLIALVRTKAWTESQPKTLNRVAAHFQLDATQVAALHDWISAVAPSAAAVKIEDKDEIRASLLGDIVQRWEMIKSRIIVIPQAVAVGSDSVPCIPAAEAIVRLKGAMGINEFQFIADEEDLRRIIDALTEVRKQVLSVAADLKLNRLTSTL
jgi:hypothetical protein